VSPSGQRDPHCHRGAEVILPNLPKEWRAGTLASNRLPTFLLSGSFLLAIIAACQWSQGRPS